MRRESSLTWIKRDGKRINLRIESYQGNMTLAFDDQGKPWLRKNEGSWKPAYLTVK